MLNTWEGGWGSASSCWTLGREAEVAALQLGHWGGGWDSIFMLGTWEGGWHSWSSCCSSTNKFVPCSSMHP